MNKLLVFSSGIILILCSGCMNKYGTGPNTASPYSISAEEFNPNYQQQLNASAHWSIIAKDLTTQLRQILSQYRLIHQPVYLHLHSEDTAFTSAFNSFMTTHMVNQGIKVSKNPKANIIYNYKIQTVNFRSDRRTHPYVVLESDNGETFVFKKELNSESNSTETPLGTTASKQELKTSFAPQLELIIDSSILNNDIYLYKTTDIYYANKKDIHLYQQSALTERSSVFDDPFFQ